MKKVTTIIPQGGKKSKNFNTTNLQNHLQKHPSEFRELAAKEKEKETKAAEEKKQIEAKGSSSMPGLKKQLKKQLMVVETFENARP